MRAEDFAIDDGGGRKAIEAVGEELPDTNAESALALVVETVDSVD